MRVITGSARGRRLITLDGNDVRPTTDRVKEAMFSAIQFDIEGRRVLDLFAGSGQLGIEALSRGAEFAVFTDSSQESIKVIKQNIEFCGFDNNSKIIKTDYSTYLTMTPDVFDIVLIDPPYGKGQLQKALELVPRVMSEYGIIVCEHPINEALPENLESFTLHKTYKFGKIAFSVYRSEGE